MRWQRKSAPLHELELIARLLAAEAPLIVADEPTSAMESTTHSQILRLLDKMNKLGNTTILIISNDIAAIANQVSA